MSDSILRLTIPLNPVTKKNSNRRTKNGGQIASKAYCQYEKDAVRLIPYWAKKRISSRVNIKAVYYMRLDYFSPKCRTRIDLQNLHNALCDVLVAAGVLEDDNCRIVYSMDGSRVAHDSEKPRTEVEITVIEESGHGWRNER